MDWKNLAAAVLTPLVAAGVQVLFALIGFELSPELFNTFVAAIVTTLLGLFFVNTGAVGVRKVRRYFAK